jgi:hypothetical protein
MLVTMVERITVNPSCFALICETSGPSSHAAANRVQAGTSTDGDQCVGTNLKEYELICVVFTGEANSPMTSPGLRGWGSRWMHWLSLRKCSSKIKSHS